MPAPDLSTYGLWLTVLGADAVEALPLAGIGWLSVDLQHGSLEIADLVGVLRVSDVPVLARTASQDPAHVARVLDTGVAGIIVPGVESGAEAAALVSAARFPPEGRRSNGTSRSGFVGAPERPLLLPMVETRRGLEAAADIASCAGVDGVFVGPYDLSLSLGAPSVVDDVVVDSIASVAATAREHGVLVGAFSANRDLDGRLPRLDLLAVDTDVTALRTGVQALFGG